MSVDPYILLGISESVDDKDVTAAYHRALRRFPPEDAPDIFAEISEAYANIKTEEQRIERKMLPRPIRCEEFSTYFRELEGTEKCLPSIKKEAWLRDANQIWLRSKVDEIQ